MNELSPIAHQIDAKDGVVFVDVILVVALENCGEDQRKSFESAMLRRGWWKMRDVENGYRVGFSNAGDDEEIVQISERDVRESAYVAGVAKFDATCLIAPDDSGSAGEGELSDSGSRPDLDGFPR